jgi:uncharacterized GH25 family protein
VTDAEGEFVLKDLRPGERIHVIARKPDYLEATLAGVEIPAPEPLQLVLLPAAGVEGSIVDEAGTPIPHALIQAVRESKDQRGQTHASADGEGSFSVSGLEPGSYTLLAQQRGYLVSEERRVDLVAGKPLSGVTLVLPRGATVEGRVVSSAGTPIAGAHVRLLPEGRRVLRQFFTSTEADGDGRYRLEGTPTGAASLEAIQKGYSRAVRDVEIHPGSNRLDFTLEAGVALEGRVLTAAGEPVAGASVQMMDLGGHRGGQRVLSRADGTFRIPSVPRGSYRLTAHREDLTALDSGLEVEVADLPVTGLEILLHSGATVQGQVLGLDFDALSDLEIFGSGSGQGMRIGEVDFEGSYRLGPLTPGPWMIEATVTGTGERISEVVQVAAGVETVVFDLDFGAGLTLRGRVLREGGPVAGARVTLQGLDGGRGAFATTNYEGAFRLSGLDEGRYRLSVQHWESGAGHSEDLTLTADQEMDVEMAGASLSGVVRSAADGAPLPRVRVVLTPEDDEIVAMRTFHTTNADGQFQFEAVTEGRWRLQASREGFAAGERTLTVTGTGHPSVDLTLQPTEGLEIRVTLPDGRPADSVQIALLGGDGRPVVQGSYRTREGGAVHLDTAPPGRWTLQAAGHNLGAVRQGVEVPGPRVTVRLPASGWLELRVPALETSAVPAVVSIRGADGIAYAAPSYGRIDTRWRLVRGRLSRVPLPVGEWTLEVEAPDGRSWQGRAQVQEGEVAEVVLD